MLIESHEQFKHSQGYVAMLENVLLTMRRISTAEEYEFFKTAWLRNLREAHADFLQYLSDGTIQEAESLGRPDGSAEDGKIVQTADEYERILEYIAGLQRLLLEMRETHTAEQYQHMSGSYLKELVKAQREVTFYLAMPAVSGREAA